MTWKSAAARRLREMAGVKCIELAIPTLVNKVLSGIDCPPTDLNALCDRLNVTAVVDDDSIPVVGELRRENGAFRILCSAGQSTTRRRFTIAHELGHVLFETSGPRPPRVGADLERLCDMLAAEILMPKAIFEATLERSSIDGSVVRRLALTFQTSLTATVLRCAELRPISVAYIDRGRKRWSRGQAKASDYRLRQLLKHLIDGEPGDDIVVVERDGLGEFYRGEWIRTTGDRSGLVLLKPIRKARS